MRIFVTGVSGSNRDSYLSNVIGYTKKTIGKEIELFSVGDYMKKFSDEAGIYYNQDKILNVSQNERALALYGAIKEINYNIKEDSDVILSSHARFYWKGASKISENHKHLKLLKPDMFLTVLDNPTVIQRRLSKKNQWKDQNFTEEQVLRWQAEEVNCTKEWADFFNKPFYVVASSEAPETLCRLMYYPKYPKLYLAHPITAADKEEVEKTEKFTSKVRELGYIVFDPSTIEIGENPSTDAMRGDTFYRDVEWLINYNSDIVLAYFAKLGDSPSVGTITELVESSQFTKDTWVVAPEKFFKGPFQHIIIEKRFSSEDDFFEFAKQYLKDKGLKPWTEVLGAPPEPTKRKLFKRK